MSKTIESIALLMNEAAQNLRTLMNTPEADKLQLRHFLPDELEGSVYMLRDENAKLRAALATCKVMVHYDPKGEPYTIYQFNAEAVADAQKD